MFETSQDFNDLIDIWLLKVEQERQWFWNNRRKMQLDLETFTWEKETWIVGNISHCIYLPNHQFVHLK